VKRIASTESLATPLARIRRSRRARNGTLSVLLLCTVTCTAGISLCACATSVGPCPTPALVGPAAGDHGVVIGYTESGTTHLACYDAGSGRQLWERRFVDMPLADQPKVCQAVVYVPVQHQGVYVFELSDGSLKRHLRTGRESPWPQVACTRRRVLITSADNGAAGVVAFDAATFSPIWRRMLPHRSVAEMQAWGGRVEVVVLQGSAELRPRRIERLQLAATDGRTLRSTHLREIPSHNVIPDTLPRPVRLRMTQLLARKGGVFLTRTQVLQLQRLYFFGNMEDATAPSKVFAIRGDSGAIVWQRDAPGLAGISRQDRRIIVAYGLEAPYARRRAKSLMALDAETGRALWSTRLSGSASRPN
jgi:hypothetical protein